MDGIFTYRDETEGKVGIGKLPGELHSVLQNIAKEYSAIIPDKTASTYHTWFNDMPAGIKSKVEKIQQHPFWHKLCDGTEKCQKISAHEMDEIYYSNPKNDLDKINLYGAASNYDIHKDCMFNFNGIKFYRIVVGLSDGNDNVVTYFNNLGVGQKLNTGDYVVFDFDRTTHQVTKHEQKLTPRTLLKLHYIVCENCTHPKEYIEYVKSWYIYYEIITRRFIEIGTDPETFNEFFWGIFCQYYISPYTVYIVLAILVATIGILLALRIKLTIPSMIAYSAFSLTAVYCLTVIVHWSRYKLFGIR